MDVMVAQSAGFCYGVKRAVDMARDTAHRGEPCVMLGSIIHNANVVAELEALGMRKAESWQEVLPGETVVIRSHGEKKEVFEKLEELGARCVNATCPNVLRIQQLVAQAQEEGRTPLIIGEPHHPEVMGVASWSDRSVILPGPVELEKWLAEDESRRALPLTAAAQTTCVRTIWESSKEILKKQCTNAKIFDTICNATHRRQAEAADLAAKVDVMVVVGDRKSANTKHLAEICREKCGRVVQIERAGELSSDLFEGCLVAGLTAGASAPDVEGLRALCRALDVSADRLVEGAGQEPKLTRDRKDLFNGFFYSFLLVMFAAGVAMRIVNHINIEIYSIWITQAANLMMLLPVVTFFAMAAVHLFRKKKPKEN